MVVSAWGMALFENAKFGLKLLGGATAAGAIYVKLGFPVPATTTYVDQKFEAVQTDLRHLSDDVLTGQRRLLKSDRSFLRTERFAVEAAIGAAKPDSDDMRVLRRRLAEIDDGLAGNAHEDDLVRKRMERP